MCNEVEQPRRTLTPSFLPVATARAVFAEVLPHMNEKAIENLYSELSGRGFTLAVKSRVQDDPNPVNTLG